jgi:hypothetical protein
VGENREEMIIGKKEGRNENRRGKRRMKKGS